MIFVTAPANETPPSFLMRTAVVNGFKSMSGLMDALGLRPMRSLFAVGNLNKLAEATEGVLGDANGILRRRTVLPSIMRLSMSRAMRDAVSAVVFDDTGRCRALDYHRSRSAYLPAQIEGCYCQKCAHADIVEYGYPIWHVEHAFRGIYGCSRHRCSLTIGCGTCQQSQPFFQGIRFPSVQCSCGKRAVPLLAPDSLELKMHIRIATILTNCLDDKIPYFVDCCDIGSVFREQIVRLNLVRYGNLSRIRFHQAVVKEYGSDSIYKFGLVTPRGELSLVDYLRPNCRLISAYNVAMLIDILFGSVQAFSRAMEASHVCDEPERRKGNASERPRAESSANTVRQIEEVKNYMVANPDTTRSEMQRRLKGATRGLQLADPEKYEEIMPASRRKVGAREKHSQRMLELDKVLHAHVMARASILHRPSDHFQCRLSARSLLLGHPSARSFYANRRELPSTSILIDQLLNIFGSNERSRGRS